MIERLDPQIHGLNALFATVNEIVDTVNASAPNPKYTAQRVYCDVVGCKAAPTWSLRWALGAMKFTLVCDEHYESLGFDQAQHPQR